MATSPLAALGALASSGTVSFGGASGRELRATHGAAAGSVLLTIPYASCILADDVDPALEAEVVAVLAVLGRAGLSPSEGCVVVLRLAFHSSLPGDASPYHAYLSALPPHVPSLLHLPEPAFHAVSPLLCGTPLQGRAQRGRVALECGAYAILAAAAHLRLHWLTRPRLLWAHCMYTSRAMSLPRPPSPPATPSLFTAAGRPPPTPTTPGMVPLMDMADHRAGATAAFVLCEEARGEGEEVRMRVVGRGGVHSELGREAGGGTDPFDFHCVGAGGATLPPPPQHPAPHVLHMGLRIGTNHAPGQAVSINYGPLSNAALLLRYGFVVVDNPADVLPVRASRRGGGEGVDDGSSSGGGGGGEWTLEVDGEGGRGSAGGEEETRLFLLTEHAVPTELLSIAATAVGLQPPGTEGAPASAPALDWADALLHDVAVAEFKAVHGDRAAPALAWAVGEVARLGDGLGEHVSTGQCADVDGVEAVVSDLRTLRRGLRRVCTAVVRMLREGGAGGE